MRFFQAILVEQRTLHCLVSLKFMPHKRKFESALKRCNKRLCITVETLLREHYAIPRYPWREFLEDPWPVRSEVAITYLVDIALIGFKPTEPEEITDEESENS